MPIVSKYVTWECKKISDCCYQHPNTDGMANEKSNGDVNFIETPYQLNGVYIGIAEHEGALPQARLDALMIVDPAFQFVSVTETQVNALLLTAYGLEGEVQAVSYSNYICTDLRPSGLEGDI